MNQVVPFKTSRVTKKGFRYLIWRDKYLLLLLLPMIVLLFIFSYIPMYGILISFQDYKIGQPFVAFDGSTHWVGFKNFIRFFDSVFFARVMKNTLLISFYNIAFSFWIPIIFAIMLNEIRHTLYKRTVQTLSYLPYFISTVIIIGIVVNFLSPVDGVINQIIHFFGGDPIRFMNIPHYFKTIFVITSVWQSFGWGSVLYLANIASIDQGLYEAAKIDGASRWKQIVHITLPGIMPTITILLIIALALSEVQAENTLPDSSASQKFHQCWTFKPKACGKVRDG